MVAEDLEGADLSDVLELHADASAWWLLPRESGRAVEQLHAVARELELDEFAVRDLTADDGRAKFDELPQARLLLAAAADLDRVTGTVHHRPVSVLATDRVLIACCDQQGGFQPGRTLLAKQDWLASGGVEAALQVVVAELVGTYETVTEWLQESSDRLADALFEERPLTKSEQLWAFRLRTALSRLRRMTDPMRTVIAELADTVPAVLSKPARAAAARHWRLLAERHERVANAADALREALSSAFDTSLALADVRLNSIMKKLTAWAAIIAVPTLVTSFVGENVAFPLSGTAMGFWVYLTLMVVSGAVLYLIFRRHDWV